MRHRYPLIALFMLAFALPAMPALAAPEGNGTINIMTLEKGTVKPGKSQARRKVPRGSSNPVYPTPLPGPQPLIAVPRQEAVTPRRTRVPPPMPVPQTGRVLPNLPATGSGRESFQDRAARCSHQAGVYGPSATGDRNAYVGSCINQ